ncbi:MAG: hypothetical protein H6612_06145 [Ignavibacteriales bacterium]|nr:hypothetical protein [Ignavibacteriales bacterium]
MFNLPRIFLISIIIPITIFSQIGLKLNLESGAFLSVSNLTENSIQSVFKLFGSIDYKTKFENSNLQLSSKIRPQFYDSEFHSFKYKLDGSYNYFLDNLVWRINISQTGDNYDLYLFDYSYNIFLITNNLELNASEELLVNLYFGYSNYKVNYSNTINSSYFFVSALANKIINNYSFLGFGIYVQRFDTESKLTNLNLSSLGWKYGPQIKAQYMRSFLFDAEYKFLIYNSNNTIFPSYEHNINLLSGVFLSKNVSLFLLAEFNFIRTTLKEGLSEENPIFYTPTQNENELYTKIAYKFNPTFSLYSKIGYFRENMYLDEYKLDGMNFLIGLELKN